MPLHGAGTGVVPPTTFTSIGRHPVVLAERVQHKWLGLLWRPDLDMLPALKVRCAQQHGVVASLAGMVASRELPLCVAAEMFEVKVDGSVRFGRWLLVTVPGAEEFLDSVYEGWARALIGSPSWRSGIIASGELGWSISGFMRGLLDLAKKRAKLWMLPDSDLYASVFRMAHSCAGPSWAKAGRALLQKWHLADWPEWVVSGGSYASYCAILRETLEAQFHVTWLAAARKHCIPVPYLLIVPSLPRSLHTALASGIPWCVLRLQRSMCRLRCGLVSLGHRYGKPTSAKVQSCIGCNEDHSNVWVHVFAGCERWSHVRRGAVVALGLEANIRSWDTMYAILSCDSSSSAYAVCLEFVGLVVAAADEFWKCVGC